MSGVFRRSVGLFHPILSAMSPLRLALAASLLLLLPVVLLRAEDDTVPSAPMSSRATSFGGHEPGTVVDYYQNRVLSPLVWNLDPGPITRIVIHLSECKLYGFQGDRLVAITSVSPGKDGHDTPIGTFPVLAKDKDHKSTEYGSFVDANGNTVDYGAQAGQTPPPGAHYEPAPMPFFLRLTDDGVGLHAGYVTGYRVSHGCIRMPAPFAEDLFSVVNVGTPVTITP